MVEVQWTDGTRDKARTYTGLLRMIRKRQWHYHSGREMREELARRAERWSGHAIPDPHGWSAKEFLQELEDAGMLVILDD